MAVDFGAVVRKGKRRADLVDQPSHLPKADRHDLPFVEQFVNEDLGNSAHLVGSLASRTAILIDPVREVRPYLRTAEALGVTITHVIDTHVHNDFVSGSREAAARTGAVVAASREAGLQYDHLPLAEGDRLPIGDLALAVMATPGHTPEHLAFTLLAPGTSAPLALFSGGALIVGGCARTDLLGQEMTGPLTRDLYHSLHDKILALPDRVRVYPTHGAGSFCAAAGFDERKTTIGRERERNPLVQAPSEGEFTMRALHGLPSYPVYFNWMRAINQRGPRPVSEVPAPRALSPAEVQQAQAQGATVLDVRSPQAFADGHIPRSYAVPLEAPLLVWAGWLIPFGARLVLLGDGPGAIREATRSLALIGYEEVPGFLEGGIRAWTDAGLPTDRITRVSARDLHDRFRRGEAPVVLDVRQLDEWEEGHIGGAVHHENGSLPFDELLFPMDRPIVVHCGVGNRAIAGISVLRRRGYRDLTFLEGGFAAWEAAGFEVVRGLGSE